MCHNLDGVCVFIIEERSSAFIVGILNGTARYLFKTHSCRLISDMPLYSTVNFRIVWDFVSFTEEPSIHRTHYT